MLTRPNLTLCYRVKQVPEDIPDPLAQQGRVQSLAGIQLVGESHQLEPAMNVAEFHFFAKPKTKPVF